MVASPRASQVRMAHSHLLTGRMHQAGNLCCC
uniref:Uncharacterized protein n=1 Tax=Arundo donax TaxID=35708 RepID=A0A0A9FB88_ARUDO